MSLYQHELFTIDLNKIIAVYQNEDEAAVTIRTDDQRKIEVATAAPEAAAELLNDLAAQWEQAVGALLLLFFVVVALCAPLITPYNPDASDFLPMSPPSSQHLLGTTALFVMTRVNTRFGPFSSSS